MKLFKRDYNFYKSVFVLALPIAGQSLISISVNMLDNIMVGSLGENALSATTLANSFIGIYHILCMGLGMGASVLVSRYWGMKQNNEPGADVSLKQTVSIMLKLTLVLAALFALATAIMPETIMSMYSSEAEITYEGIRYLRWSVVTYFFLGASLVSTIVLRSVGMVLPPLLISIGSFFVNLAANYTFIFGKFGAPRMGVAGAALGTLIARLFETFFILLYLLVIDQKIGFRLKHIFMETKSLLSEYMRISIPVLVSDGILAIGANTVSIVIGHLGAVFVAANSITAVTQQLSTVVVMGASQAGAIVTSRNLGEGKKEEAMEQGYLFYGLGIVLGLISATFIICAKGAIIGYFKGVSQETADTANQLMWAISLVIVFQATNSIMTKGVLRGGGDTKMLMVADNIFLWILSIPMGIIAGYVFKLPAFWIFIALKFDQIVKAFWSYGRLVSGKWIKKISTGENC